MTIRRISTVCQRLLAGSFAAVALAGLLAGLLAGHVVRAVETTASVIEATAGKDFSISLDSNPTTGFGWQLAKPLDGATVKSVKNAYQATPQKAGAPPKTGVGGTEVWTFKAVNPGKTVIEFKYVRPWEKDQAPARTTSFQVVVKAAK